MLNIQTRGGFEVCVPDSIQRMTTYILLEQEDWFEDEIKFIPRAISPGSRVIDIGANYGLYTLTLGKCSGPEGKVWAFEPASQTADYLAQSITANEFENIELIRAALSAKQGKARLNVFPESELNSLVKQEGAADSEAVEVLTLDDCAREYAWQDIDFVKLDAEGEEERILDGGRKFFSDHSPLVMFELKHGANINHALLDRFSAYGFKHYILVPGLQILAPFVSSAQIDAYALNIFCCKPDRADKLERLGLLAGSLADQPDRVDEDKIHWRKDISSKPYARAFKSNWKETSRSKHAPGWNTYQKALSLYSLAHSELVGAAQSRACLEQARQLIEAALEQEDNISRQQSYARILWETGLRKQAVDTLVQLIQRLTVAAVTILNEPFIPAAPCFDKMTTTRQHFQKWCLSSVYTQFENLIAYSSYFTRRPEELNASLARLDYLHTHAFNTPGMERRRQLMRILNGLQDGVKPCILLEQESVNHLNARLWLEKQVIAAHCQGGGPGKSQ